MCYGWKEKNIYLVLLTVFFLIILGGTGMAIYGSKACEKANKVWCCDNYKSGDCNCDIYYSGSYCPVMKDDYASNPCSADSGGDCAAYDTNWDFSQGECCLKKTSPCHGSSPPATWTCVAATRCCPDSPSNVMYSGLIILVFSGFAFLVTLCVWRKSCLQRTQSGRNRTPDFFSEYGNQPVSATGEPLPSAPTPHVPAPTVSVPPSIPAPMPQPMPVHAPQPVPVAASMMTGNIQLLPYKPTPHAQYAPVQQMPSYPTVVPSFGTPTVGTYAIPPSPPHSFSTSLSQPQPAVYVAGQPYYGSPQPLPQHPPSGYTAVPASHLQQRDHQQHSFR